MAFCSYGTRQPATQLDGAKFTKLCRDSGLIDKKLSKTDVELIFAKVRTYPKQGHLPQLSGA